MVVAVAAYTLDAIFLPKVASIVANMEVVNAVLLMDAPRVPNTGNSVELMAVSEFAEHQDVKDMTVGVVCVLNMVGVSVARQKAATAQAVPGVYAPITPKSCNFSFCASNPVVNKPYSIHISMTLCQIS
jgi:hypothetical protein